MFKPDSRLSQRVEDELEWMSCPHPAPLLNCLKGKHRERKLRLFACASWRWLVSHVHSTACESCVATAERFADDKANAHQLAAAVSAADIAADTISERKRAPFDHVGWSAAIVAKYACDPDAFSAAFGAVVNMPCYPHRSPKRGGLIGRLICESWHTVKFIAQDLASMQPESQRIQSTLLREIFGNPFRSITFSPAWRTDTAMTLARQMYDSREFSAMPILADALQDAGCDNDDLLNHLRDPDATHVRGCWALDLVLGKE